MTLMRTERRGGLCRLVCCGLLLGLVGVANAGGSLRGGGGAGDAVARKGDTVEHTSRLLAKNHAPDDSRKRFALPLKGTDLRKPSTVNYTEEALADEIKDLPGLKEKIEFRQFSGYLRITNTKRIFYWFVESESDPDVDPLVLWTNGGPGCSGLFGFMNENGPFRSTPGGLSLDMNPYAWNKVANMLFVEQPVGVGFSRSDDGKLTLKDDLAAVDNYLLVQKFLERFPHLRTHDLHLSGESYAGHYLPQLAKLIVDNNEAGVEPHVNLKGFLVGNPLTNPVENMAGMFQSYWGAQLVPHDTYHKWETICGNSTSIDTYYTAPCVALENQMLNYVSGLNAYALDFPVCMEKSKKKNAAGRTQRFMTRAMMLSKVVAEFQSLTPKDVQYQPCEEVWSEAYLNREDVKAAIHADANITWNECSDPVFFAYSSADRDMYIEPFYNYLLGDKGLRILVFSGDDDSVCATQGTQLWISEQSWKEETDWEAWSVSDQVAGYIQKYEHNFTFATVHGAGHEVPAYKPVEALALFSAYLTDSL